MPCWCALPAGASSGRWWRSGPAGVLLKCGDDSFSHCELWRNVYHLPTQEIPGLKGYRLPSSNMSGLDEMSFQVSI